MRSAAQMQHRRRCRAGSPFDREKESEMRDLEYVREHVATMEGAAPPPTMCPGELIMAALGTGGPGTRAKVEKLIQGRSVRDLATMPVVELRATGLTQPQAERVRAAFLLGRMAADEPLVKGQKLTESAAIFRAYHSRLRDLAKERFMAVLLDAKNRVLHEEVVSEGILTASLVHPREVFGLAIRMKAAGIVLIHNHPSGDPEPSPEDHEVTRRLQAVGELVGIRVLDHVIVGDGRYVSFLERGLIG